MAIVQPVAEISQFFRFQNGGQKSENFISRYGAEGQNASQCQITWRLVKSPILTYPTSIWRPRWG